MPKDLDWDQRLALCRDQLDFVRFLVGTWDGRGQSRGEEVRARLVVRDRFEHTFLQAEEQLFLLDGSLAHEDLAMLRYDPEEELTRVTHYMARGWVSEQLLRPLDDGPGCFWFAGPFAPRVEFRPQGSDRLEVTVWLPEEPQPDTQIHYHRVGGPTEPAPG